jgi:ABC-type phosphate/phosphonate transport system substrate-binding protein
VRPFEAGGYFVSAMTAVLITAALPSPAQGQFARTELNVGIIVAESVPNLRPRWDSIPADMTEPWG